MAQRAKMLNRAWRWRDFVALLIGLLLAALILAAQDARASLFEPDIFGARAAHSNDLASAKSNGLMTGHIARPNEHGPGKGETGPKGPVDVFGSNLEDLAGKLGL